MNMVPHHDEIVHPKFRIPHVGAEHIGKQVGHAITLEDGLAFGRSRGNEKCTSISFH